MFLLGSLFFPPKQLSNFLNVQDQTLGRRHCQWIKSCQISVISRRSNMLQTPRTRLSPGKKGPWSHIDVPQNGATSPTD